MRKAVQGTLRICREKDVLKDYLKEQETDFAASAAQLPKQQNRHPKILSRSTKLCFERRLQQLCSHLQIRRRVFILVNAFNCRFRIEKGARSLVIRWADRQTFPLPGITKR